MDTHAKGDDKYMNAVKVFKNKIERIDSMRDDGTIIFHMFKLSEQDMEDLSHLRIDNITGNLFDDRERQF